MPGTVALAGGVGGAKLAHGLMLAVADSPLSVVVNTADDFNMWGLRICPDLDTVMYTLAGIANPDTGWGVAGDSWSALEMLRAYGQDTWFRIGDRDLATHVLRTSLLASGQSLTQATARLSTELGIPASLLPMCDEPVATIVDTPDGPLEFQQYFVARRHAPVVTGITFQGLDKARPTPAVMAALEAADVVVFCPSNPFVSIGPILAVPSFTQALRGCDAVKVAVSPIVGGEALKGPAAEMLTSLGHEVSALGVARLYMGLVQGMVIDDVDRGLRTAIEDLGMDVLVAKTIMRAEEDRRHLAEATTQFARSLSPTAGVLS